MTGSDSPGVIRSIHSGRAVGRTASLEESFVRQARCRALEHEVYAVVGPDSSEEFVERVRLVCPVVVDEKAEGVALLLDGRPSEWTGLGDAA